LSARGATVGIADLNEGNAKTLAEEIVASGDKAYAVAVDLRPRLSS